MNRLQKHLRNTFLAGIFAAIPLAVTAFILWYADAKTRVITDYVGLRVPFLGVLFALGAIYVLGLLITSLIGRYLIGLLDALLGRIPVLRSLYVAWKQVALTPGGTEGTFAKVVLIPVETGRMRMMGFTSGQGIAGDPETVCVFVPAAPNPISGRLYFVRRCDCQFLDVSPEEAFKVILSTGNYVPRAVGEAMAAGSVAAAMGEGRSADVGPRSFTQG